MRALLAPGLLLLASGCSASRPIDFVTSSSGDEGGAGAAGSSGSSGSSSGGSDSTMAGGSGGSGGTGIGGLGGFGGQAGGTPVGVTEVFGHSADTLYKLDPISKEVTVVGAFTGINGDAMIDIALDKNGEMIGTAFGGLYKIDKTTASATLITSGSFPNSLSFVPQGTVDPNVEALVGYEGSTYVRIDTTTGQKQNIGSLVGGYGSSGDVVSVIGGGTYLTVFGGPDNCGDCIIEVDPTTGSFKTIIGPLGHSAVYGLAFWGGAAYGFDSSGQLFQIDLISGTTTTIPQPNAPSGLYYYGAGSSTAAPLEPPE
jgi:hypothetical protein